MNTELLNKVKAAILAEPLSFDMRMYVCGNLPCGTTACIAGWACAISFEQTLDGFWRDELPFPGDYAQMLLGLDWRQRAKLFNVSSWPQPFQARYISAKPKRRCQIAADRIDHFVATEGME